MLYNNNHYDFYLEYAGFSLIFQVGGEMKKVQNFSTFQLFGAGWGGGAMEV